MPVDYTNTTDSVGVGMRTRPKISIQLSSEKGKKYSGQELVSYFNKDVLQNMQGSVAAGSTIYTTILLLTLSMGLDISVLRLSSSS